MNRSFCQHCNWITSCYDLGYKNSTICINLGVRPNTLHCILRKHDTSFNGLCTLIISAINEIKIIGEQTGIYPSLLQISRAYNKKKKQHDHVHCWIVYFDDLDDDIIIRRKRYGENMTLLIKKLNIPRSEQKSTLRLINKKRKKQCRKPYDNDFVLEYENNNMVENIFESEEIFKNILEPLLFRLVGSDYKSDNFHIFIDYYNENPIKMSVCV
jgi:hypothetical protein